MDIFLQFRPFSQTAISEGEHKDISDNWELWLIAIVVIKSETGQHSKVLQSLIVFWDYQQQGRQDQAVES